MSYLNLLDLKEEPFSNSPDPEFFYESPQHLDCLHRLEISVRLMRGLNVVLGEVGAGKSTLCRLLLRNLNRDAAVRSHLLLDPQFSSAKAMLEVLYSMFLEEDAPAGLSEWQLKEAVKNQLFRTAVDDGKLVTLIIDEGQKISHTCLEVLRELLNYETNNTKLLQIVIFAQTEFAELIRKHPNVADRVNEFTVLGPLNFLQTRAMIRHRMARAAKSAQGKERFTFLGYLAVHRITGGYPRKIVRLCHKVMLGCILRNQSVAGWRLVHACNARVADLIQPQAPLFAPSARKSGLPGLSGLAASLTGGATGSPGAAPARPRKPRNLRLAHGVAMAGFVLAGSLAVGALLMPESTRTSAVEATPGVEALGDPGTARTQALPTPLPEEGNQAHPAPASPAAPVPAAQGLAAAESAPAAIPEPAGSAQAEPSQAVAASNALAAPVAQPPSLGTYTTSREMSVQALLQLVYGQSNPGLQGRFRLLNPELQEQLPAGAAVQLPEQDHGEAAAAVAGYVVQITQDESLQLMVDVLQGLRDQGLDVAMAAQQVEGSRRLFAILKASEFQSEHAAALALRELPAMFQPGAKVVRDMHRKGDIILASFRKETASVQLPAAGSGEGLH
ncbi:ExeA family protein [Megalodesulfovibrio paquesii]